MRSKRAERSRKVLTVMKLASSWGRPCQSWAMGSMLPYNSRTNLKSSSCGVCFASTDTNPKMRSGMSLELSALQSQLICWCRTKNVRHRIVGLLFECTPLQHLGIPVEFSESEIIRFKIVNEGCCDHEVKEHRAERLLYFEFPFVVYLSGMAVIYAIRVANEKFSKPILALQYASVQDV
ncbi:hypothetical protein Pfo_025649 [Paulownia fortunei]|nr:hypothetical protein Pfo_025649 [Paulownia fortunei]